MSLTQFTFMKDKDFELLMEKPNTDPVKAGFINLEDLFKVKTIRFSYEGDVLIFARKLKPEDDATQ